MKEVSNKDFKKNSILREWIPYVIIVIVVLIIKAFVITPIKVNGPSMKDTLHHNDVMILNEISYRFQDVKRFDIVVIHYQDEYIIKRVIGLPGEKIKYKDNKLYINGKYIKQDFSHQRTEDFEEDMPDNKYFVLGDNRVNSTDSRVIGVIDREDILGKTNLTIFPFNRFGIKK